LAAQLATVTGIPAVSTWGEENVGFEPTIGTAHLTHRLAFDPDVPLEAPARLTRILRSGVFEVRLKVPPLDGTDAVDALALALLQAFPYGKELTSGATTLRIPRGSRRWGGGLDDDKAWYVVLVEVRFELIVANTLA
jgi:hypothetical protein